MSYIGIDSRTAIQTTADKLAVFPVGATISMSVNFYDNIGDKFHATNAVLHHRLNRFDLLQLQSGPDNGTFVARAAHAGSTVLKVGFDMVQVGYLWNFCHRFGFVFLCVEMLKPSYCKLDHDQ